MLPSLYMNNSRGFGARQEKGCEVDKRTKATLPQRQDEKVGAVHLGKEKVVWRSHGNLPVPESGLQGSQRGTFCQEL